MLLTDVYTSVLAHRGLTLRIIFNKKNCGYISDYVQKSDKILSISVILVIKCTNCLLNEHELTENLECYRCERVEFQGWNSELLATALLLGYLHHVRF